MIIENMPFAQYLARPEISRSGLALMLRSPAHFRYAAPATPSRAMTLGSAVHCALLEPSAFADRYVMLRDVQDRRASAYKQAVAEYGEDYVLISSEADQIEGMIESVGRNRYVSSSLASKGRAELTVIAKDPATGVAVRIRPDWVPEGGPILDVKTTVDARAPGFARSVVRYGYHMQDAFYRDAWTWATGDVLPLDFLAIEKEPPYACRTYMLDSEAVREGRRMYREALDLYARCLDADQWPAYDDEPEYLALPPWAVESNLDGGMNDE